MRIISEFNPEREMIATVGVWDPFMDAHRELCADLRDAAAQRGLIPYVLMLDPHPARYANGNFGWASFDDIVTRQRMAEAAGVTAVVIRFEPEDISAGVREFLDVVEERGTIAELWLGASQSLGTGAGGSHEAVNSETARRNIVLRRLGSSSLTGGVRHLLLDGRIHDASLVTGRLPTRYRTPSRRMEMFWKEGPYQVMTVRGGILDARPQTITMVKDDQSMVSFDWPDDEIENIIFLRGPGDMRESYA